MLEDKISRNINAGWEARDGHSICRWMLVWVDVSETEIAGCAAGYSGGGAFQLEKFYLRHSGMDIKLLQIDNEDKISLEPNDFSAVVPSQAVAVCEDCQDQVLSWHDEEKWEDDENLCLLDEKFENVHYDGDLLFYKNSDINYLVFVLEVIGITSKPTK